MRSLVLALASCISFFFIGCSKVDELSGPGREKPTKQLLEDPTVLDGTLSFKKSSDFYTYLEKVSKMSEPAYYEFLRKYGISTGYSLHSLSVDLKHSLKGANILFSRLTDSDGCVYVGGHVIFYSDKETKIIQGVGKVNKMLLLSADTEEKKRKANVRSGQVKAVEIQNKAGRPAPFSYEKIGNGIDVNEGQTGIAKLYSKMEFFEYDTWVPTGQQTCWFVPGTGLGDPGHTECIAEVVAVTKVMAQVTATFRASSLWGNYIYLEPEDFNLEWSFKVNGVLYGGSYTTCCTSSFSCVMEARLPRYGEVTEMNVLVYNRAYLKDGSMGQSSSNYVFDY